MPYHKQFISGFDFEDEKTSKPRKPKFDKSTVIPDCEKSCHNCINSKLLNVDRKGIAYHCDIKNYIFMDYWKQTIANTCNSFKKE